MGNLRREAVVGPSRNILKSQEVPSALVQAALDTQTHLSVLVFLLQNLLGHLVGPLFSGSLLLSFFLLCWWNLVDICPPAGFCVSTVRHFESRDRI